MLTAFSQHLTLASLLQFPCTSWRITLAIWVIKTSKSIMLRSERMLIKLKIVNTCRQAVLNMFEASWSWRFAGIERFSAPESGEKRPCLSNVLWICNDVAAVAFKTCFDLISYFWPVVESSRLAQSRNRDRSLRMSSPPKAPPQYSDVLWISAKFVSFCFPASFASALCQTNVPSLQKRQ